MFAAGRAPLPYEWKDPRGAWHSTVTLMHTNTYSSGDLSAVQQLLQGTPTAVPTPSDGIRFVLVNGNEVHILDGDRHGNIADGHRKIQYRTLAQMMIRAYRPGEAGASDDSPVESFSTERLLADVVYGKAHTYGKLPCHQACFLPGVPWDLIGTDPGFVNPIDTQLNAVRIFSSAGAVAALRDSQYHADASCCDRFLGENALGLESTMYTYRLARGSSNGRSASFDNYWGERTPSNENCEDKTQRRCMALQLGSLDTSVTRSSNVEPFTITWTRTDTNTIAYTEDVAVGGHYWFRWATNPQWPGLSRVEDARDRTIQSLGNGFGGGRPVTVIAFDLTGPVGVEHIVAGTNLNALHRDDSVFSQTYQ